MHALKVLKHWPALALALAALPALAATKELPPKPTVNDVIKASRPAEWRALDPENTLYMDIPSGRVIIELAPAFAPHHAANIRAMVREGYFDGLAIYRSQDNWVVQWGDPDEDKPKPLKTAKAKHDWDKQKCQDQKGAEEKACKKQADADEKKAIADAKAARSSDKRVASAPEKK